jgi:hypothetical protein
MSTVGDNYIVPGANPINQIGGIDSITAATPNVIISGTPTNKTIGVTTTTGVTTIEGQNGNVNLNGVGMTIAGSYPIAGDITFTAAVQTITSANASVTVTQPTPGNFDLAVPVASVTNVTGVLAATVTQPTPGTFQVSVPNATVTNVTGTGAAAITQPSPGSFNVNVPIVTQTIVTGTNGAVVTQPTPGTYNVNVANPTVTALTGTGAATVSQTTPGVFNVNVPSSTLSPLNSYVMTNSQIGTGSGYNLVQGSPTYFDCVLPNNFPYSVLSQYQYVDINVDCFLTGTGAYNFGSLGCSFGFIWTNVGGPFNVPATLQYATNVNPSYDPFSFNLGFIRIPASQFQPGSFNQLYLYVANSSPNPAVVLRVTALNGNHRVTLTN